MLSYTVFGCIQGLISITFVFGLQNTKFAKAAPCAPTITSAFLNRYTCSKKDNFVNWYLEKPLFFKKSETSLSFWIWQCLEVESVRSINIFLFALNFFYGSNMYLLTIVLPKTVEIYVVLK